MKDDLVGYLLGALEPDEHERVEHHLQTSPEAREQLGILRRALSLMEADAEHHDPPFGLAHRTCQWIDGRANVGVEVAGGSTEGGWRMRDLLFAAGTCIAASLILMVAVDSSRRQVKRLKCERNLQEIHLAMVSYSDVYNGYFPFVSAEGRLGHAGVYAPTLVDSGQIQDCSVFHCPADEHNSQAPTPTRAQLLALSDSDPKSQALCKSMGGSYGYAFGYLDDNHLYRGRRNEQSPYRALLADQPPRPAGKARHANSPNHAGRGQNVLYEDGHIQFITDTNRGSEDNIFVNYLGEMSAGIDANDSVVGYSERRAF